MKTEEFPIYAAVLDREHIQLDFKPFEPLRRLSPDGEQAVPIEVSCHLLGHISAPEDSSLGYGSIGAWEGPLVLRTPDGEVISAADALRRARYGPRDGGEYAPLGFWPIEEEAEAEAKTS